MADMANTDYSPTVSRAAREALAHAAGALALAAAEVGAREQVHEAFVRAIIEALPPSLRGVRWGDRGAVVRRLRDFSEEHHAAFEVMRGAARRLDLIAKLDGIDPLSAAQAISKALEEHFDRVNNDQSVARARERVLSELQSEIFGAQGTDGPIPTVLGETPLEALRRLIVACSKWKTRALTAEENQVAAMQAEVDGMKLMKAADRELQHLRSMVADAISIAELRHMRAPGDLLVEIERILSRKLTAE